MSEVDDFYLESFLEKARVALFCDAGADITDSIRAEIVTYMRCLRRALEGVMSRGDADARSSQFYVYVARGNAAKKPFLEICNRAAGYVLTVASSPLPKPTERETCYFSRIERYLYPSAFSI